LILTKLIIFEIQQVHFFGSNHLDTKCSVVEKPACVPKTFQLTLTWVILGTLLFSLGRGSNGESVRRLPEQGFNQFPSTMA